MVKPADGHLLGISEIAFRWTEGKLRTNLPGGRWRSSRTPLRYPVAYPTQSEIAIVRTALQNLSVELDHEMSSLAFTTLSALAGEHRLSIYDAAYLELALRKKLPLGCKDGPLREAAKRCHLKSP